MADVDDGSDSDSSLSLSNDWTPSGLKLAHPPIPLVPRSTVLISYFEGKTEHGERRRLQHESLLPQWYPKEHWRYTVSVPRMFHWDSRTVDCRHGEQLRTYCLEDCALLKSFVEFRKVSGYRDYRDLHPQSLYDITNHVDLRNRGAVTRLVDELHSGNRCWICHDRFDASLLPGSSRPAGGGDNGHTSDRGNPLDHNAKHLVARCRGCDVTMHWNCVTCSTKRRNTPQALKPVVPREWKRGLIVGMSIASSPYVQPDELGEVRERVGATRVNAESGVGDVCGGQCFVFDFVCAQCTCGLCGDEVRRTDDAVWMHSDPACQRKFHPTCFIAHVARLRQYVNYKKRGDNALVDALESDDPSTLHQRFRCGFCPRVAYSKRACSERELDFKAQEGRYTGEPKSHVRQCVACECPFQFDDGTGTMMLEPLVNAWDDQWIHPACRHMFEVHGHSLKPDHASSDVESLSSDDGDVDDDHDAVPATDVPASPKGKELASTPSDVFSCPKYVEKYTARPGQPVLPPPPLLDNASASALADVLTEDLSSVASTWRHKHWKEYSDDALEWASVGVWEKERAAHVKDRPGGNALIMANKALVALLHQWHAEMLPALHATFDHMPDERRHDYRDEKLKLGHQMLDHMCTQFVFVATAVEAWNADTSAGLASLALERSVQGLVELVASGRIFLSTLFANGRRYMDFCQVHTMFKHQTPPSPPNASPSIKRKLKTSNTEDAGSTDDSTTLETPKRVRYDTQIVE